MAIAGQRIIYEPTFVVADDLRAGTLIKLPLDHPTVEFGRIYAVFLPDRHPPAKVRDRLSCDTFCTRTGVGR